MAAMHVLASARPDFVIVDISLNGPDGIELLKNLRTTHPVLPVLILSMHDESIYAERALRAGANGYIMKQEATEKVLVAVRRILSGEIYVSDRIGNRMLKHYITGSGSVRNSTIADLSDRELEVLPDWRGPRHAADCRRVAPERKDGRILPGAHQGKALVAQCPRVDAARDSVEHERKSGMKYFVCLA